MCMISTALEGFVANGFDVKLWISRPDDDIRPRRLIAASGVHPHKEMPGTR